MAIVEITKRTCVKPLSACGNPEVATEGRFERFCDGEGQRTAEVATQSGETVATARYTVTAL
jgi:hypothetical protein